MKLLLTKLAQDDKLLCQTTTLTSVSVWIFLAFFRVHDRPGTDRGEVCAESPCLKDQETQLLLCPLSKVPLSNPLHVQDNLVTILEVLDQCKTFPNS